MTTPFIWQVCGAKRIKHCCFSLWAFLGCTCLACAALASLILGTCLACVQALYHENGRCGWLPILRRSETRSTRSTRSDGEQQGQLDTTHNPKRARTTARHDARLILPDVCFPFAAHTPSKIVKRVSKAGRHTEQERALGKKTGKGNGRFWVKLGANAHLTN